MVAPPFLLEREQTSRAISDFAFSRSERKRIFSASYFSDYLFAVTCLESWLHKARALPKEDFRREVEKELTGKETEPSELIYFKVYRSQIPVIEQAIETAALMLGTDKSRGYCLEMICADFLAGAHLGNGDPEILLNSILTLLQVLARRTAAGFPRKPA
jgi:hypothetical protein